MKFPPLVPGPSPVTLTARHQAVFLRPTGLRAGIRAQHAGRDPRPVGHRRSAARWPVGLSTKLTVNDPTLASPTVTQRSATVRSVAPPPAAAGGQEVLVRGLAEGPAELATEVRGQQVGGAGERRHVERFG